MSKSVRFEDTQTVSYPYWPLRLIRGDCGHVLGTVLPGRPDPALGAEYECDTCKRKVASVLKAREIVAFSRTGDYSHTTLRDLSASRTGAWMTFCCYRIAPASPTGCLLHLSCEAGPEETVILEEAGVMSIPGPSRGQMAML